MNRQQIEDEVFDIMKEHYDCDGGPEAAHIITDRIMGWLANKNSESPASSISDTNGTNSTDTTKNE